jgi:serine/threonine-protein kinase RsbW
MLQGKLFLLHSEGMTLLRIFRRVALMLQGKISLLPPRSAGAKDEGGQTDQAMNATRVTYTLESTLETVNKAEETALAIAAKSGFDEDEVQRIAMAVREATVNAVLHGNAYDPNKRVIVSFESSDDALTVTVKDEGKGLSPDDIPDPLAPENLLKQSGRGIFLIRAFMDEVRFRNMDPGTEITLIKHVSGADRDGKEASK